MLQILPRGGLTVLPGPIDDLLPLATQFGRNLKKIFDPQGFQRDEITKGILSGDISADPFAQAVESGDSESMRLVLESFGLSGDDKTNIEYGTAQGTARQRTFEQKVGGKLTAADVELGAAAKRAGLKAEVAESGATGAEAEVREVTASESLTQNLPKLQVDLAVASTEAAIEGIAFDAVTQQAYVDYVASLPPNLQGRAAIAFKNPEFLRDLQHMENLNLEQLKILSNNAATQSARDAAHFAEYVKLQNEIVPLVKQLFDKDTSENERNALIPILQNLFEQQTERFPEFRSSVLEVQKGLFGEKVVVTRVGKKVDNDLIDLTTFSALTYGKGWEARLRQEDAGRRARKEPEIISRLIELDRWDELKKVVNDELNKAERGPVTREAVVGAVSGTTGISPDAINTTIEAMAAVGAEFADRFVGLAEWIAAGGLSQRSVSELGAPPVRPGVPRR